jgi:hypothetical protein
MLDTKNNLSDSDFNKLAAFIYTNYGIKLPITKQFPLLMKVTTNITIQLYLSQWIR